MSSSNLIRRGGLATILAGALVIITTVVAFVVPLGSTDTAEKFATSGYAWMVWLLVLGLILLQIGLVTMYAERSEALGVTGLVGFVVAFFTTALTLGYQLAFALVVPTVAGVAPDRLIGTLLCCGLLMWVLSCLLFSTGFSCWGWPCTGPTSTLSGPRGYL